MATQQLTQIRQLSSGPSPANVDAEGLADDLRKKIKGEVRFDNGSRALYATDASNYRQVPIGVVIPRDADDIVETVAAARRFGAPILARGGGTSLAGQCCNVAVVIDMASYKAEFLSHYYAGRLRPVTAYSMGLIYWWSRIAALTPKVANFFTQTPLLSDLVKLAGGVATERSIPAFAQQTFKKSFKRQRGRSDKPRVILWPDTFNNHFYPETAEAACEVLEAAGFRVEVPLSSLCCGRPLYDYGMLKLAKRLLRQILDALKPQIEEGVPVVVLEPSCAAVFRDELTNLLPNDETAARLSGQTFLLSEFLEKKADGFDWPKLPRRAIVHGHCHHKAIMKMADEEAALKKLGLDYELLASGCCGMAGSFGFERGEHYDVSVACGERSLLPAVREAAKDTIIVADGFSCREQIAQLTDRQALHLAQVIKMATDGVSGASDDYPESLWVKDNEASQKSGLKKVAIIAAGAAIVGGLLLWRLRRH